jgi:hypothetical protein
LPLFLSVTVLAGLVVPCTCDEKERLVGETEAVGAVPVPTSVMDCVEPRLPESSEIFSEPYARPVFTGANETETVQLDPGARPPGQLLVLPNAPLVVMLNKSSELPPKLTIVTGWVSPLVPAF